MLQKIFDNLPTEIRDQLGATVQMFVAAGFLSTKPPGQIKDELAETAVLAHLEPKELVDVLGRWVALLAYLHELSVMATMAEKRVSDFQEMAAATIRMDARARIPNTSTSELADLVRLDPVVRALGDAVRALSEVKYVVRTRADACEQAIDAVKRALAHERTETMRRRSEVCACCPFAI